MELAPPSSPRGDGYISNERTNPTQFKRGQSGNPAGKPKGTRNATTLALEALLDGQASALTQKAINLTLAGDMAALRLCLDRILPPRKTAPWFLTCHGAH